MLASSFFFVRIFLLGLFGLVLVFVLPFNWLWLRNFYAVEPLIARMGAGGRPIGARRPLRLLCQWPSRLLVGGTAR